MWLQYNADVISALAGGHEDKFGIHLDVPLETQKDVREVLALFQFHMLVPQAFPILV